jgi:hypothetical protein
MFVKKFGDKSAGTVSWAGLGASGFRGEVTRWLSQGFGCYRRFLARDRDCNVWSLLWGFLVRNSINEKHRPSKIQSLMWMSAF